MVVRSDPGIRPSAVESAAVSATAAMATAAESLQSRLGFVLDEQLGSLTPDQRKFLETAAVHGQQLLDLVRDLRTVVLAELGELDPTWKPCDLAALVQRIGTAAEPVARLAGKSIEVTPYESAWVTADRAYLGRAICKLVDYGLKQAPVGSKVVLDVGPSEVDVLFPADEAPAEGPTKLSFAESVGHLHGGGLAIFTDTRQGLVRLSLSLATPETDSRPALAAQAA